MSRVISVLIADDHALMRAGLRLLLATQPDIAVVGECGTHQDVLDTLREHAPGIDVVTLDLTMPGGPPAALIADVVRAHPSTRVLVVTMHDDPGYARMALAAGAAGYVVKSAADRELLQALREVAGGGTWRGIAAHGMTRREEPRGVAPGRTPLDTLSEREREVLVLVAQGHTSQQIADRLFLSVKTIESYRSRLMTKLGLSGRAELTRFAIDAGLLAGGT
jgi:two-component system response regulator NreC